MLFLGTLIMIKGHCRSPQSGGLQGWSSRARMSRADLLLWSSRLIRTESSRAVEGLPASSLSSFTRNSLYACLLYLASTAKGLKTVKESVNVGESEPLTMLLQLFNLTLSLSFCSKNLLSSGSLYLADLTWVQPSRFTEGVETHITFTFKSVSYRMLVSKQTEDVWALLFQSVTRSTAVRRAGLQECPVAPAGQRAHWLMCVRLPGWLPSCPCVNDAHGRWWRMPSQILRHLTLNNYLQSKRLEGGDLGQILVVEMWQLVLMQQQEPAGNSCWQQESSPSSDGFSLFQCPYTSWRFREAHWFTCQMMMPSMSRATEHTTARTHILLRDFFCNRRIKEMINVRLLPAGGAATHLVVGRPLELLRPSLHVNFSIFHICLDAICTSRVACVSWVKRQKPNPERTRSKQAWTGARCQPRWSLINHPIIWLWSWSQPSAFVCSGVKQDDHKKVSGTFWKFWAFC